MSCRILIADDHELVRCGLKAVLQPLTDVVVCGEAVDGMDAIEKAQQLKPDIIIMDIGMRRANGAIAAQRILERNRQQKVLIFGVIKSEEAIRYLLRAGIQGVVSKNDPASDILNAVEALRRDRVYFTARVEEMILSKYFHTQNGPVHDQKPCSPTLSLREQEVIQLLAEGDTTRRVAATLGISHKTAATHRSNLMRKLHIHNLAEVTLYAISHNIVEAAVVETLGNVQEFPSRPAQRFVAKAAA